MKCVKQNNRIKRVDDEEAKLLVSKGAEYAPKWMWKAQRDADAVINTKTKGAK